MERRLLDILTVSGEVTQWSKENKLGFLELPRRGDTTRSVYETERVRIPEEVVGSSGLSLPLYLGVKLVCETITTKWGLEAVRILSIDERSAVSGENRIGPRSCTIDFVSAWEMVKISAVDEELRSIGYRSIRYAPVLISETIARRALKGGAHLGDMFEVRWTHGENATKVAVDAQPLWSSLRNHFRG